MPSLLTVATLTARWPVLTTVAEVPGWLHLQEDLGLAPRTVEAYARALTDYLTVCDQSGIDPLTAGRADVARYVRTLRERPLRRRAADATRQPTLGVAPATLQQRLTAVRLFYDYLVEEGRRATNPVGRGHYRPGRSAGERGLVPRVNRLPWIPNDAQWRAVVAVARDAPIRTRLMLALAYDAGLRREELCSLATDDLDPAHRLVRVRAETTKSRRERVVPYSAVTGRLLQAYLIHRRTLSPTRGPLFLSESRRNPAQPLTIWTWSKAVRHLVLQAGVPQFSTHTLRHLCLTDLARAGWDLHAIAQFAGHRHPATTLQYIHLSGRDLTERLARGMEQIHAWRMAQRAAVWGGDHDDH
jgi:site-specific recombinase XerD